MKFYRIILPLSRYGAASFLKRKLVHAFAICMIVFFTVFNM
ncbi:MAG: hypothetical protein WAX69_25105 [Victivallales bacterium]